LQKTATAVAHCKQGKGLIKINGVPLGLVQPEILRFKVREPLLLLGPERFAGIDIRVRVNGGGHTSQIYGLNFISFFLFLSFYFFISFSFYFKYNVFHLLKLFTNK